MLDNVNYLNIFSVINKVPGNFHISGHHYPEAVQKLFFQGHKLDFSHKINHLSFGSINDIEHIEKNFNEKTLRAIANTANVAVAPPLISDGNGTREDAGFEGMIRHNVRTITAALGTQ